MRILKKILLVLAVIAALVLLVAAFVDGQVKYEKSIDINASIDRVWSNVNSLSAMEKWSPWGSKDSAMKRTYSGSDGDIGSKFCWESAKKEVGKGCQTLVSRQRPNRVDTELKFLTPYESEAKAYILLASSAAGTKATWGFTSEVPYPFRIMNLFTNLDEMLDPDYTTGLKNLKKISEQP